MSIFEQVWVPETAVKCKCRAVEMDGRAAARLEPCRSYPCRVVIAPLLGVGAGGARGSKSKQKTKQSGACHAMRQQQMNWKS